MKIDELRAVAEQNGYSIAHAAIEFGDDHSRLKAAWNDIIQFGDDDEDYQYVRLYDPTSDLFINKLAVAISQDYKFPRNTIMLHAMGVITSAMCKSFTMRYRRAKKPCTMYTVTAQPPSTGKSGVNDFLTHPIRKAYDTLNQKFKIQREEIEYNINRLKADLKEHEKKLRKNPEDRTSKASVSGINKDISNYEEQLNQYPNYIYALNDATVESAEAVAGKQDGMFNIVSAEADALNIILGNVYKTDGKSNMGVILSAWDGEFYSSSRLSRDAFNGYIRGCVAVIAQDESIDTILNAGADGRGVSERFLILKEKSLLGTRDFSEHIPIPYEIEQEYKTLVENIVLSNDVCLEFTKHSMNMVNEVRQGIESEMGDNGLYGANMIRGFVGKADKHIMKIACVLHVSEQWGSRGNKDYIVSDDAVAQAIGIFDKLMGAYVLAAKQLGHAGVDVETEKVIDIFKAKVERRRYCITFKELRDQAKGYKIFKGVPELTKRFRNRILPELIRRNYVIVHNNNIHINPSIV